MDEQEKKRILLGILQDYAPNDEAQALCARLFWEWEKADRNTVMELSRAIYLGLKNKNWPWGKMVM